MQPTVSLEVGFFLASFGVGLSAAFVYDILRISRRIIGPRDSVVTFEDIIFIISAAFLLFYAAYKKNNGEIRLQSFIGSGLGIFLYVIIIKNRFLNLSIFLIRWMTKLLEKILRIILFPVRLIFLVFRKPISIIIWYTGQKMRRARRLARQSRNKFRLKLKKTLLLLRKK